MFFVVYQLTWRTLLINSAVKCVEEMSSTDKWVAIITISIANTAAVFSDKHDRNHTALWLSTLRCNHVWFNIEWHHWINICLITESIRGKSRKEMQVHFTFLLTKCSDRCLNNKWVHNIFAAKPLTVLCALEVAGLDGKNKSHIFHQFSERIPTAEIQ